MARKNGKIKSKTVNYSSRGKGATKINSSVDTTIVRTGKRIGKNATRYAKTKYADIIDKQRRAQKMIDESHKYLKKGHYAYTMLSEQKATFYHKRGVKSPSKLSFKNLSNKDLKAYENMLDSIIDNTYFDKKKYDEYRNNNLKTLEEKFFTSNQKSKSWFNKQNVDDIVDILDSQVAKDLIDLGLKYEIRDTYMEYYEGGLDEQTFIEMLSDYTKAYKQNSTTLDNFLNYSTNWLTHYANFIEFVNMEKFNADEWELYKEEYYNDIVYGGN